MTTRAYGAVQTPLPESCSLVCEQLSALKILSWKSSCADVDERRERQGKHLLPLSIALPRTERVVRDVGQCESNQTCEQRLQNRVMRLDDGDWVMYEKQFLCIFVGCPLHWNERLQSCHIMREGRRSSLSFNIGEHVSERLTCPSSACEHSFVIDP